MAAGEAVAGARAEALPAAGLTLHFARFEFKYLLPAGMRAEIEKELGFFLEFDPYAAGNPDRRYFVRSLYFDDPALSSYYDKIDGLHTRAKFRLRTYTDSPERAATTFLEIKGRYNNLVFKHRTPVRAVGAEEPGETATAMVLRGAEPGSVRSRFEFELHRKRLEPVALVDYHRRAFVSKYDPDFRLTFDDDLLAAAARRLFPSRSGISPRRVVSGCSVMEVKFRRRIPAWFHRIIQSYELRRTSISKICRGLEALGLVENLE